MLAEQASSYSAVAAERATHLGKAAADYSEGARSQLATLQLPDTLANLQVAQSAFTVGGSSHHPTTLSMPTMWLAEMQHMFLASTNKQRRQSGHAIDMHRHAWLYLGLPAPY